MTAMLIRNVFIGQFGDIYDYISIVHPQGYRQVLMTDYRNHIKKGHTAMFLSKPGHQFYLYMHPSLKAWLDHRNNMI
jgi:hypothetical protein